MIKWRSLLFFIIMVSGSPVRATLQNGIGVETSFGYPTLNAQSNGLEARYNGFSMNADILLPIWGIKGFTIDLDLGYRYSSYQNNASDVDQSEWAILQGFSPGFRFNFKYIFAGTNVSFIKGKHLIAGAINEINEYNAMPVEGTIGFYIPLNEISSIALSYSQYLFVNKPTVAGHEVNLNEQHIMLRIQFDSGIGFFNEIKEKDIFNFDYRSI